jgi:hypothetical protein
MSGRETTLKLFCTLTSVLILVALPLQAQSINIGEETGNGYAESNAPFDPTKSTSHEHLPAGDASEAAQSEFPPLSHLGELEDTGVSFESFAGQSRSDERLIDRIVDPTAWLLNFRFRESWNWPVGDADPDSEEFEFRPTVPFKAWEQENILRVTVPYDFGGSDGSGLGDVTILDLVVHEARWGRWGVGPVVRLTPGNGSDSDTFQIGPAVGAVSKDKHWTIGFLTQNFFGNDVAESRIQPILAYKFNDEWAIGVGEFEFRYNWEDMTWTQVPLGVEVDYIADIYGQKIQFFVNPQYNLESDASNSGWTLFLGLSLLVPAA